MMIIVCDNQISLDIKKICDNLWTKKKSVEKTSVDNKKNSVDKKVCG